ncbi:unnamed protein product [Musa acuminata subsp. burmannicoides]
MVRLVFRPYTQVRRTICTSVSLRASTRVSSGFASLRHSSPSFGSRHACSNSNPSQKIGVGTRKLTGGNPLEGLHCRPTSIFCEGFELEHACRDPKDGELCLSEAKPEETLVEARSDTDVQIVRLTWV